MTSAWPGNAQWWILLAVALLIVAAWPPDDDKSLALKLTNWTVDPGNTLPILPGPFGPGQGDERQDVEAHDLQVRMYDELYARGGWTRLRLQLKVAGDPMNPATERQLLLGAGVLIAFLVWRSGNERGPRG
jgi:hypothetical protein